MSPEGDLTGAATRPDRSGGGPDAARQLFRYVTSDSWLEYREVMGVFAGTFFAEFTPEDVGDRLAVTGDALDIDTLTDRLESLRRWGNLTVSSATGNPTSIVDYYRRRNRYLVTRAGQEVHDVVEGVLTRVDEVRDVSTSRLRALHEALVALVATDAATVDPGRLADAVRAVFDPHEAFTTEITQFFAAINQWQSRYDLTPEEFSFFAEVLVGYVAERLEEIERTSRPIGRLLSEIAPHVGIIVERAAGGLAARVEAAGLAEKVAVSRAPGSRRGDWEHLIGWFVTEAGRPSRIDRLGREAIAAIRTLTLNLTRLSRVGIGAASRRGDFLRLARLLADADPDDAPRLVVAAFGLNPSTHWGIIAEDADDPVSPATPWRQAPRAPVAVSLRERGDTTNRGRTTPMRDRAPAERRVRHQRELAHYARRRVDAELLTADLDARELSVAALARLQELVERTLHRLGTHAEHQAIIDGSIHFELRRVPGGATEVRSVEGKLTLEGLRVTLRPADRPDDIDAIDSVRGDTAAIDPGAIDTAAIDTAAIDTAAIDTAAIDTVTMDNAAIDTAAIDDGRSHDRRATVDVR